MTKLLLKNICSSYKDNIKVINNINLDVVENEFLVFVGPSGCGKSTILKIIAGLQEISQGELFIDNKLANNISAKDRDIAMVFQNYALYPHMSVYENIAFGLKIKKANKEYIRDKVEYASNLLSIGDILDKKTKDISGGQKQRVALARAFVMSPKIFLMDEPLSNLDAKLRSKMRLEIMRLCKELKSTFIYVTHDQIEAMTMGDRIVVMKDGVIEQIGTPKDIYEKPNNMFVASFIGSPQINFIDAYIELKDNSMYINFNDNEVIIPKDINLDLLDKNTKAEIFIGIRPEHFTEGINEKKCLVFKGKVKFIENTGFESYLHLDYFNKDIVVRTTGSTKLSVGDLAEFLVNINKIYIFNKYTGARII